jgi:hypothetical protein
MKTKKEWHGTLARYNKTKNMVCERRVCDFVTAEEAKAWINKHPEKPVYIWHDNAVTLHNPYLAIVETNAYWNEWRKEKNT